MLKKLLIASCFVLPLSSIVHADVVEVPAQYNYKITDKNNTVSVTLFTQLGESTPIQILEGDKGAALKSSCVIKKTEMIEKSKSEMVLEVANENQGKGLFVSVLPYLYDKDKNAVQTLIYIYENNTKVEGKPVVVSDTCTIQNATSTTKTVSLFKRLNLNEKTEIKMPDGNDVYITVERKELK